jgi:hypothetical protein
VGEPAVPEERRADHGWEALKLYFEFFKHFTTLSSAFALVVIALQRSVGLGPRTTTVMLVVLGVNLVLSLCGVYVVMFRARKLDESPSPRGLPVLLMWLTIIAFFAGLFVMLFLRRVPEKAAPIRYSASSPTPSTARKGTPPRLFTNVLEKPSEKPHERANLLAIRRLIAT